jgi:hypothetical protein
MITQLTAVTAHHQCEMIIKIMVFGLRRYWKQWRNRFDGVYGILDTEHAPCYSHTVCLHVHCLRVGLTTLASLSIEMYIVITVRDEALIRYIVLIRMLRMLRILGHTEKFAIVFQVCLPRRSNSPDANCFRYAFSSCLVFYHTVLTGLPVRDFPCRCSLTCCLCSLRFLEHSSS